MTDTQLIEKILNSKKPQDIPVTIDGELKKFKYHEIAKNCGITWVHPSYCNTGILNYTYEQDRI